MGVRFGAIPAGLPRRGVGELAGFGWPAGIDLSGEWRPGQCSSPWTRSGVGVGVSVDVCVQYRAATLEGLARWRLVATRRSTRFYLFGRESSLEKLAVCVARYLRLPTKFLLAYLHMRRGCEPCVDRRRNARVFLLSTMTGARFFSRYARMTTCRRTSAGNAWTMSTTGTYLRLCVKGPKTNYSL